MTDDPTGEDRQFASQLFAAARRDDSSRPSTGLFSEGPGPDDGPAQAAPASNHVRREGGTPTASTDPMRDFVGDLFGIDLNARGLNTSALD